MSHNKKIEEFFSKLETDNGKTVQKARYRRRNRAWLRKSQRIAIKVYSILKSRDLSQGWLAGELGVSRQQVSKIIKGKENLTLETISKLENVLDTKLISVPDFESNEIRLVIGEKNVSNFAMRSEGTSYKGSEEVDELEQDMWSPEPPEYSEAV